MKPSNYQIYQRTGFIILAKAIEYCDSDVILDINWKKPNSRIYHYGTNTIEIFVTQSNGNTGRSLAFDPYIGFLMFAYWKKNSYHGMGTFETNCQMKSH